jgi:hypothetical protein
VIFMDNYFQPVFQKKPLIWEHVIGLALVENHKQQVWFKKTAFKIFDF